MFLARYYLAEGQKETHHGIVLFAAGDRPKRHLSIKLTSTFWRAKVQFLVRCYLTEGQKEHIMVSYFLLQVTVQQEMHLVE